ncbi:MAG: hypothetical protein F8N37_02075 [Telmatospirillum sp.]|nr:hypothetical protein [Telmatospirillum sp.]
MKTFRIENAASGSIVGEYKTESELQALNAMAQDIGYETHEQACEAVAVAPQDLRIVHIDCETTGLDEDIAAIVAAKRDREITQVDPDDLLENWIATHFDWADVEITRDGNVIYTPRADGAERRYASAEQISEILALYNGM